MGVYDDKLVFLGIGRMQNAGFKIRGEYLISVARIKMIFVIKKGKG